MDSKLLDSLIFSFATVIVIVMIYLYTFNQKSILNFFRNSTNKSGNKITGIEVTKLFWSVIAFYVAVSFINPISKLCVHWLSNKSQSKTNLYDIFHNLIPHFPKCHLIGEIVTATIVSMLLIQQYIQPNIHFMYNAFFLLSILIIIRGVFYCVTILPDASQQCQFSYFFGSCHDLMFSGHASIIFGLLLLCVRYQLFAKPILSLLFIMFGILIFCMLSTNKHYTIDILVAIIITYAIYKIYFYEIHALS